MELRYTKNGIHYVPERKGKDEEWKPFTQSEIEKYNLIKILANAIATMSNRNSVFYSNTKTAFFYNEVEVMAFLGGVQAYFREESVDFEIFISK
jgi:hypothetical protein